MASVQLAQLLSSLRIPEGVQPLRVSLPSPPELKGALAPNNALAQAVKFADNIVSSPESMVISNGYVYTGLSDGYVVEIKPSGTRRNIRRMSLPSTCGQTNAPEGACGRPMGIRESGGNLIVADAYHGIIALNPSNGDYRILVSGTMVVNGKKVGGFINDVAVSKDGSIYFTTSSSKYTLKDYHKVTLEAETSGRVLVYNARFPGQVKVKELVTTLSLPNGLQLSKDEDFLLIAEGARAKIHKAYIDRRSPKFGQIEVFASNLPGFVDNIRASPRGTYWVGLSGIRYSGQPSVLDEYGNSPRIRAAIMAMPREAVFSQAPKYGLAVELNAYGQIIRSLHDPTGAKFTGVSEIQEEKDTLYIGSFDNSFIGKLNMKDLPPVYQPPKPDGTNSQLKEFLNQIRDRVANLELKKVQELVVSLVWRLVQAQLDSLKSNARIKDLEQEVARLRTIVDSMATTSAYTTTTPSTPTTFKPSPQTPGSTASSGGGQTPTTSSAGGSGGATTPSLGTTSVPTTSSGSGSGTSGMTTPSPTTAPTSSSVISTALTSDGADSTQISTVAATTTVTVSAAITTAAGVSASTTPTSVIGSTSNGDSETTVADVTTNSA